MDALPIGHRGGAGYVCSACEIPFPADQRDRLTVRMIPDAPDGERHLLCIPCSAVHDRAKHGPPFPRPVSADEERRLWRLSQGFEPEEECPFIEDEDDSEPDPQARELMERALDGARSLQQRVQWGRRVCGPGWQLPEG